jgi:hypothetical protein
MSNWDTEEDDSQLVKDLRAQIKTLNAKNTELTTEVGTLRPQVRKTSVASILNDLGVNTKIAGLLPDSVEPTKEAVETWLKEYGDVFGAAKVETEKEVEKPVEGQEQLAGQKAAVVAPVVNQTDQLSWARIQSAESTAGSSAPDIEQQQIAQLGAAAAAAGGNYDAFISYLKGEKALPTS